MRTRKIVAAGAACLVALATALAVQTPASAVVYPITTFVSVLTPEGNPPNNSNRMVLDVLDGSVNNGAPVQMWRQNGNLQQSWTIYQTVQDSAGRHSYVLRNKKSDMCLDMAIDGAIGNGTRVQQWTCNVAPGGISWNQRWRGYPVAGSAWIELRPVGHEHLCLDVTGANNGNGARLQVFTCTGGWNQRFNVS